MYGLRQSPRSGSDHRDREQCIAEPNLWRTIRQTGTGEELVGLVSIYVDYVLTTAETALRNAFEKPPGRAHRGQPGAIPGHEHQGGRRCLDPSARLRGRGSARSPKTKEMNVGRGGVASGGLRPSRCHPSSTNCGDKGRPNLLFGMSQLCSTAAEKTQMGEGLGLHPRVPTRDKGAGHPD